MDASHYPALLDIARVLLSEDDDAKVPEVLLRRVLEATGAERGFIVVREGGSFEERFSVRFDRDADDAGRRFSRSLVRRAIETRAIARASADDSPGSLAGSFEGSGVRLALAAPLARGAEVHGVLYLEYLAGAARAGTAAAHAGARPLDGSAAVPFLEAFADMAALHLQRAIEREELRRRNRELERDLFRQHDFRGIVTRDAGMVRLLETVAQVAGTDATVLVRGETGTGKELIARALHENGPRRGKPYVTLHTSALPGTILEAELFGHVKGAFTGADRDRVGRIASAQGGTLFLDEVAEITADVQAKLLRFLQFGEIQRVGSDRTEKVDVRIVAATHQDLAALVETGKLRRDLYYRLKVIELFIPPLRDRRGDLPLLIDHFLHSCWKRPGAPRLTPRAERALLAHSYPGNVRELAHAVERACILARSPDLDLDVLPPDIAPPAPSGLAPSGLAPSGLAPSGSSAPTVQEASTPLFPELTAAALETARESAVADVEQSFLEALLARHAGNVSAAARESGLNRTYLQKLLARRRKPAG